MMIGIIIILTIIIVIKLCPLNAFPAPCYLTRDLHNCLTPAHVIIDSSFL